jgi:hypothetical protein
MKNIFTAIVFFLVAFSAFTQDATTIIGYSSEHRQITVSRFGPEDNENAILLVGGMHGTYESNTYELMAAYKEYLLKILRMLQFI